VGDWSGTVPSFAAGAEVPGADLQTLADIATALTAGWSSHTPVWTATGSNPALVNGTSAGKYIRLGKLFLYQGRITAGSSTTFGTGSWLIDVPGGLSLTGTDNARGFLWISDSSTPANNRVGFVAGASATTLALLSTGPNLSSTSPFTWATSDRIEWIVMGEVV